MLICMALEWNWWGSRIANCIENSLESVRFDDDCGSTQLVHGFDIWIVGWDLDSLLLHRLNPVLFENTIAEPSHTGLV